MDCESRAVTILPPPRDQRPDNGTDDDGDEEECSICQRTIHGWQYDICRHLARRAVAHIGTYALEASALRSEVHRYRLTVPLWLVLWLTFCLNQRKDAFHVEV